MVRQAHHERIVELALTAPLILSLSKDGQGEESPDREGWFDKLTMSGLLSLR